MNDFAKKKEAYIASLDHIEMALEATLPYVSEEEATEVALMISKTEASKAEIEGTTTMEELDDIING